MSGFEHGDLFDRLLPAVLSAGAATLRHWRTDPVVRRKGDDSPVTAADEEADAIIASALGAACPGIPVVTEEQVAAGNIPAFSDVLFLVDPLDGTREFISGSPEYTVNVALSVGGEPAFGIVYAPAMSRLYATVAADAAIEADVAAASGASRLADLQSRRLRPRVPDPDALRVVSSKSHANAELDRRLARYPVAERIVIGSSLKFCAVARGDADFYPRFGTTSEWDTAAGHAVLAAVGGCVTELDGRPLRYGRRADTFDNPWFVAWGTPALADRIDLAGRAAG